MSPVARKEFSALPFVPHSHSLSTLRKAAKNCEGCPLFQRATQTVFGEGAVHAPILLVGEQPGDQEDLAGKPFVGPAGKLLDKCLAEAGIERTQTYVTNMVKHFKWEPRGKRRIHEKPNQMEISACKPWLKSEIEAVQPKLVVALGATAAQGLLGSSFRVTKQRGTVVRIENYPPILATVHPSSLLRQISHEDRERETKKFVADLTVCAEFISEQAG
ncbi:MAG TPA: UdgX family uracil-DNA binding protein [Acidobacteriaceae bacterium]|nr:UdgX family uracil-DNA binding protein [Acidobacteriaceae bacterium]